MSGKPRDFGAFLKARSAQISRKIAELKQQLTELDDTKAEDERELRELEKLQADITEFEQALDIALHWPPSREQMGKMVRDGFLDPEHLKSSRPLPVKFDFAYDKKKNQIKRVPKSGRRPALGIPSTGFSTLARTAGHRKRGMKCHEKNPRWQARAEVDNQI